MDNSPLLSMNISATYAGRSAVLRDLQLEMRRGEILGLVGLSGCGKSTLSLAIPRLLHLKNGKVSGSIAFNGLDLMGLRESQMRSIRGRAIALILQSPVASLNPALRIQSQLDEAWLAHSAGSAGDRHQTITQALRNVSLSGSEILRKYPSQLSVGQAQRVLIAMAILHKPDLLVADEPTSALDAITRSEIMQLFASLNRQLGTAILFVSHDMQSVATISDRVAVMSDGQIVEIGSTEELFAHPQHHLTMQLLRTLPSREQYFRRQQNANLTDSACVNRR